MRLSEPKIFELHTVNRFSTSAKDSQGPALTAQRVDIPHLLGLLEHALAADTPALIEVTVHGERVLPQPIPIDSPSRLTRSPSRVIQSPSKLRKAASFQGRNVRGEFVSGRSGLSSEL